MSNNTPIRSQNALSEAATNSVSPDNSILSQPGLPRKRKRERHVLSCLDCRRRKVKCDRDWPVCGRCKKGGNSKTCIYKNRAGEVDRDESEVELEVELEPQDMRPERRMRLNGNGDGSMLNGSEDSRDQNAASTIAAQEATIRQLQRRIADLERDGALTSVSRDHSPNHRAAPKDTPVSRNNEASTIKGQGFRTHFFGATSTTSLFAQFPEVREFFKEARTKSALPAIHKDMQARKYRQRIPKKDAIVSDLRDLLPDFAKVDRLVQLYLDTFETTYRILHVPSFQKDYENFWKSPQTNIPGFAATLLMILATVNCMSNERLTYNIAGSSSRQEAIKWIQACDYWMDQQSQKHRYLAMYQVMCLRILAVTTNELKKKVEYLGVEAVINYFKAAGMHRDPTIVSICSPFDGEMRRRLWATAVELELEASLDRGMPSSLTGINVDCKPPSNFEDEDLRPDLVRLPGPKPTDHYSASSFLHIAAKSLSLRKTLCALINDPTAQLRHEDALRYEKDIMLALSQIPRWADKRSNHASALLDLQLRQFILLIHTPFATRDSDSPSTMYSRMVCFDTAKSILELHFELTDSGNLSISMLRDDVFRAAISICHNAFLSAANPNNFFSSGLFKALPSLVGKVFYLLEVKCTRRGVGLHNYWYISSAYGLAELTIEPKLTESATIEAAERIVKVYDSFLDAWEKEPVTPDPIGFQPVNAPLAQSNSWYYGANHMGFPDAASMMPGMGNDMFDASDWTFDNVWPIPDMDGEYGVLT